MMERTAELLRAVMQMLPPPPDSTIELSVEVGVLDAGGAADVGGSAAGELGGGEPYEYGRAAVALDGGSAGTTADGAAEGDHAGAESVDHAGDDVTHSTGGGLIDYNHNIYCQSFDLYLYCRPVSDFWEKIWKENPLVLHDKELLDASKEIHCEEGVALIKDRGPNFTREITGILSSHPGPVSNFRLDSSVWSRGGDQLGRWMAIASGKGVEEVIIINTSLPTDVSFPITRLQSPVLRHLSLGFMHIDGLAVDEFNYSSLAELSLFGCTYEGEALSAVISECSSLRQLVIGCSNQSIRVVSQSLLKIKIWKSTFDSLDIEYAPKL
ncbi:hypothetical protein QOZ80_5AG0379940 [Eleusine coracana subsp. coracana]|nr:hypothetical protein QOZ80_5AG0379940 [Eleusine coracana subsp. coracana]